VLQTFSSKSAVQLSIHWTWSVKDLERIRTLCTHAALVMLAQLAIWAGNAPRWCSMKHVSEAQLCIRAGLQSLHEGDVEAARRSLENMRPDGWPDDVAMRSELELRIVLAALDAKPDEQERARLLEQLRIAAGVEFGAFEVRGAVLLPPPIRILLCMWHIHSDCRVLVPSAVEVTPLFVFGAGTGRSPQ